MLKIDSSTGEVVAQANLVSSIGYTTRPVYAQGVIMVPLDGGAVQALTADNLTTVWATDKLSDSAQSNSAITVNGNYAYVGTCDVDFAAGTYDNGFLTCINILTGAVVWQHNNANEGYYWGGAVNVGGYTVVATSAGTVEVLSGEGSVVSTVSLGALVNSSCVASADGKTLYVMSRDGKLHVLAIDEQGSFKETKVVDLGLSGCASMPTVNGSTMYVGGEVESGAAALAIVDLKSLESTLVTQADGALLPGVKGYGGIKAAPLVSTQNGETYVYFTVNYGESSDWVSYTSGGGVYRYKVGDAQATLAYDAKGFNNYCDSPVICDAEGNLYYINDSGTLFKLVGGGVEAFARARSCSRASAWPLHRSLIPTQIRLPVPISARSRRLPGWSPLQLCLWQRAVLRSRPIACRQAFRHARRCPLPRMLIALRSNMLPPLPAPIPPMPLKAAMTLAALFGPTWSLA